jgi:hypothetical protein
MFVEPQLGEDTVEPRVGDFWHIAILSEGTRP